MALESIDVSVAIAYHSGAGHTARMADAVATAAATQGRWLEDRRGQAAPREEASVR